MEPERTGDNVWRRDYQIVKNQTPQASDYLQAPRDEVKELVTNVDLGRQAEGCSLNLSKEVSINFTL